MKWLYVGLWATAGILLVMWGARVAIQVAANSAARAHAKDYADLLLTPNIDPAVRAQLARLLDEANHAGAAPVMAVALYDLGWLAIAGGAAAAVVYAAFTYKVPPVLRN